jgi:aldehyde oxidoreductase
MISFILNGETVHYTGAETVKLLAFLREIKGITSVKDGCSGQAACGACLVELDGKPALSCATPMKKVAGKAVVTLEGFPETVRRTLGRAFVAKGAVQCGYCTPGMISRAKILLQTNPNPSRKDVINAFRGHICRCTGYIKIIDAVLLAARALRQQSEIPWEKKTGIGHCVPKVQGYEKALGTSPFITDLTFEGMVYGVLKFSDHPRARVLKIDSSVAEKMPGVMRVFTAEDIPGQRFQGLIVKDWPMMVQVGETTRCIGDVLAGVVAQSEDLARLAVASIDVAYEVLTPVTEMTEAADSPVSVHGQSNLLTKTVVQRGDVVEDIFGQSAHVVEGRFETPFVEHAFLETEASIALPVDNGRLRIYSQNQGIFADREQIASILNLSQDKVNVIQFAAGGAFGGKEDLTVQHHAALYSTILKRPVKVRLNRAESLRMHPKRHRAQLHYKLGCDAKGQLTALKARIIGDTGAYASVGGEVVARMGTHAAGAYHVPNVDVEASAYYTNNIPAGAFRGFGVNQATFAMESMLDELCVKGGFDRWQFRYDNALDSGRMTTTGHVLGGSIGLRQCLTSVKKVFNESEFAGLACAVKNCGIGNGLEEVSETRLKIIAADRIELSHGWTEMGQGIHTVAKQMLCEVLGIDNTIQIDITCETDAGALGGMTTASRGTVLMGNSVLSAAAKLKVDLEGRSLSNLVGRAYEGRFVVDWTTAHDVNGEIISHFSYGFAVHLALLDESGKLQAIHAAHDVGKIINPVLFEGQIEGGVVMGMGYALSERLPLKEGRLTSERLSKLGLPRAKDVPQIKVIGIECPDAVGPYGARGVGEICCIPTAPAIANAFFQYDGKRRYSLPLSPVKERKSGR